MLEYYMCDSWSNTGLSLTTYRILLYLSKNWGHAVAQLVEALHYKPGGRGLGSRWCGIFHWHNPSGRAMALELIQPLTEMSTMNVSWGVKAAGARAENLTTFVCRLTWNLGASTSWNPQGLSRPVMEFLYLFKQKMVKNFDTVTPCVETTDRSSIEWWQYPRSKILPFCIISYSSPPLWPMSTIWKLLSLNKGCNKKLLPSALLWTEWLDNYMEIHIETCVAEGSVISHGDVKGRICEVDFCPLSIVRYISSLHLISWFWTIRPQDLWSHDNDIL